MNVTRHVATFDSPDGTWQQVLIVVWDDGTVEASRRSHRHDIWSAPVDVETTKDET